MSEIKKNISIKLIVLGVFFVILSIVNLLLVSAIAVLPQNLYNIYAILYICTRVFYTTLFFNMMFTGDKKELYNFYSFFVVVELLMIINYALFLNKSILISVIISIVFIVSSANFSKNLFVKKDGGNLVQSYILIISFNIVIVLFVMVFLFYAFNNLPVLKQITEAIKFLIESANKAKNTANAISDSTKGVIESAKTGISSASEIVNDIIGKIGGFFGG